MYFITILFLSAVHCCKTRNDGEDTSEENYAINDTRLIALAGYEENLNNLKINLEEYEYEEEGEENLQMWGHAINEDSLLKKVENNLQMEVADDNHDDSSDKFEALKSYMSKNCLKDFDIFLSMNHEDEWEKYHNEIMQLETQYRKWEKNESDNEWEDITKPKWVVPPM